jgi:hypothetical protein
VNTPAFDSTGGLEYIIHRVEDVTEFVHLKEHKTGHDRMTRDLRLRTEQMEGEVFSTRPSGQRTALSDAGN